MVQPLRKTVQWFLTKRLLPYVQFGNQAPWYLPKGVENLGPQENLYTDVYSSLVTVAKTWQPGHPSEGEWISKLVRPDSGTSLSQEKRADRA